MVITEEEELEFDTLGSTATADAAKNTNRMASFFQPQVLIMSV
jgi:hypothetical protein